MTNIFNDNTNAPFTAKYVSRPGEGGAGGILTFSPTQGSNVGVGRDTADKALLCSTADVVFSRTVTRHYFINVSGTSFTLGRGTGTLTVTGLLGSAKDFAAMFGTNAADPCKNMFTVKLDAFGMQPCDGTRAPGCLVMYGVIPQQIRITTEVEQSNGALYYRANGVFEISALAVDDKAQQQGQQEQQS